MKLSALLDLCRRELAAAGIDRRAEAEILVSAMAGVPRSRLFAEGGREAGDLAGALRAWIARRAAGEPIQYILGAWEFYGREFRLTRDTLIPRPETEGLVERVVDSLRGRGRDGALCLDVGTGSGAIAVTLAAELPAARVVAVDISAGALRAARDNAVRHGVSRRVRILRADAYSALKCGNRFDVVVSNPPYIPEGEWDSLPAEVRGFEPPAALLAGADGLDMLRRLAAGASEMLAPGGELWCEIGESQGEAVRRLPSRGMRFVDVYRDLAGRERIARWEKAG
ncbi:MAG: peptide chain release factor N(5)-glutamine methyltransferase [Deltaproteobacteria bacterium]|nr:peptide chain release factor N(5)-glutamine methyltransferase [Deltaproteobacteria bacterium]